MHTKVVKVLVQKCYPFSKRRDSRHYIRVNEPQVRSTELLPRSLPQNIESLKNCLKMYGFLKPEVAGCCESSLFRKHFSLSIQRGGMQLSSTLHCIQTSEAS